jgi:hypothetical protein
MVSRSSSIAATLSLVTPPNPEAAKSISILETSTLSHEDYGREARDDR